MKAIIKFDLDVPEDRASYRRTNKALEMALVLWEIKHNLRKELEDSKDVDKVFYNIFDLMDQHGIVIDELID